MPASGKYQFTGRRPTPPNPIRKDDPGEVRTPKAYGRWRKAVLYSGRKDIFSAAAAGFALTQRWGCWGHWAFPSLDQVAALAGVKRGAIEGMLKRLVENGYLHKISRTGEPSIYCVVQVVDGTPLLAAPGSLCPICVGTSTRFPAGPSQNSSHNLVLSPEERTTVGDPVNRDPVAEPMDELADLQPLTMELGALLVDVRVAAGRREPTEAELRLFLKLVDGWVLGGKDEELLRAGVVNLAEHANVITYGSVTKFVIGFNPKLAKKPPVILSQEHKQDLERQRIEALEWEAAAQRGDRKPWRQRLENATLEQLPKVLKQWRDAGRGGPLSPDPNPF